MLLAGAPLAARQAHRNFARTASGVTDNRMVRTRQGVAREERAATSVRRAGGEATLRALTFTGIVLNSKIRVPEVSLRRRRVLLVAARSSPCGAAWGDCASCD